MAKLVLSATLLVLSGASPAAHARTWTSAEGQSIEAELVDHDSSARKVTIRRSDGREFILPVDRLSEKDRSYLAEIEAKRQRELDTVRQKAGTVETHTSDGEEAVRYHVAYPGNYDPEKRPPLLILFSPGGNGKGILKSFREAAGKAGWIAVGCDGFKNNMDEEAGHRMFSEVLPHIENTVVHDNRFLFMGGMSGGAWRAYHYSARFDRPWKGIAACGGWLGGSSFYDLDYPKGMAVAIINGDKDKGASSWADRDTEVLEECDCEVRHFKFPGGHVVGPPEVLKEALQWMDSLHSEN